MPFTTEASPDTGGEKDELGRLKSLEYRTYPDTRAAMLSITSIFTWFWRSETLICCKLGDK